MSALSVVEGGRNAVLCLRKRGVTAPGSSLGLTLDCSSRDPGRGWSIGLSHAGARP